MALPSEFLGKVRASIPMPELVGRKVDLTRSGKSWKGLCPFHEERSPSFYVYDDGYHCFGCGAHGDAIGWIMGIKSLSFAQAVADLAAKADLTVPGSEPGVIGSAHALVPAGGKIALAKDSAFTSVQVESVLATAARLLVCGGHVTSASILANAGGRLDHWEHDNWNGGQDTWRLTLAIPADVYVSLEGREDREKEINAALGTAAEMVSNSDFLFVRIATAPDEDPNWRQKVNQHLSGVGITNQGRVKSDNIASREHDGLLFRSKAEVHVYNALKRSGVAFAPLSVVLHGGITYRRVEPDFVIYREGEVMIVEIDGDLFHRETPAAAHARLKFLIDEGVRLERIEASECDTADKAREAVDRILATIDKLRRAR